MKRALLGFALTFAVLSVFVIRLRADDSSKEVRVLHCAAAKDPFTRFQQ